ncbi:hypothetical protein [uncultured Chryseobacterium sp.]|uniref:hypothetical protein n=1 Tax=uncultured Chryseobacterium sp. TaxID=259322 RepID=UPI0025FCB008|nr:hypothetical protein [uncultured Chryseobacterium sp.]
MNIKEYDELMKNTVSYLLKNTVIIILISLGIACNESQKKYSQYQNVTRLKVISDPTNTLIGKTQKLDIEYTAFGCACPGWIRVKDLNSVKNQGIKNLYFYIEPADENLELPVYFDVLRHFLRIKGQFYTKKDVPRGTIQNEEPMPKGKVFRYTELEVLDKPDFKSDSKIETLFLDYNAIACTCAQWSESHKKQNEDQKIYYWLEPANGKLMDADKLFTGNNLPVKIKVTGQVVSEKGFPKNKNLVKVSEKEAGKVFRYTNIKVLRK